MYEFKQLEINKDEILEAIDEAIEETKENYIEPMYWVQDIPVFNSSFIAAEHNIKFAALATFNGGEPAIITDILFNKYLTEEEQNIILAHEIGHYEYRKKGVEKKSMSKLEWEILADMYAVSIYGHDRVLDTIVKVAKIAKSIYDDIDTDEIKYRLVEIEMDKIRNR